MNARPLFQLNPRLAACAAAIQPGETVADIGTDHAYLPIWLVKSGACPHAVAMDVRPGPLHRAEENIRRYRVEGKISLRLSDGLAQLRPGETDAVVLAGMGGELMARILQCAPWLKEKGTRLILQPMSAAAELRMWLAKEGYLLQKETAVLDAGRIYTVIEASFTGRIPPFPSRYPYVGALDKSALSVAYAQRELRHLQNQEKGAAALNQIQRRQALCRAIEDLTNWLEQGGVEE